ncbi:carbohydrate ABC transporter permease [Cohnella nanjingensis]|uniref:Sugar ABC transporter permease n=1 Tax=Cohnella nanjingensis TaxID=1387779 RepID=A0A7X0RN99_9BACL|nr:sugar ABC transporter permease [Cohnella nanjingensis]MBB6670668.1 sugar ABC transporter permease [Cohnella nanjingensis]
MSRMKEARYFLAFLAPWLIGIVVFVGYPIIHSLYLSFTDASFLKMGMEHGVGFKNYRTALLHDVNFGRALVNSLWFSVFSVPLVLFVGLIGALLLNRKVKGKSIFRTLYFLPSLIPAAASVVLAKSLFEPQHGFINTALGWFGIQGPGWMTVSDWALQTLVINSLWGFGPAMIIFLAGLQSVPASLYDAANIDGASKWQMFRNVTFPMISPVFFFNLVTGCIGSIQTFTQSFTAGGAMGSPGGSTLFYVVYLYAVAFQSPFRFGYGSALAWILFVIVGIVTLLNFVIGKKYVHYDN